MKNLKLEEFTVRVRAGPNYSENELIVVNVNEEENPMVIDGDNFCGFVCVRMVNYPSKQLKSDYFKGKNRRYSIMIQGRFKHEVNGDDVVFGVDGDIPLR